MSKMYKIIAVTLISIFCLTSVLVSCKKNSNEETVTATTVPTVMQDASSDATTDTAVKN
jgi:hypothetical protein